MIHVTEVSLVLGAVTFADLENVPRSESLATSFQAERVATPESQANM